MYVISQQPISVRGNCGTGQLWSLGDEPKVIQSLRSGTKIEGMQPRLEHSNETHLSHSSSLKLRGLWYIAIPKNSTGSYNKYFSFLPIFIAFTAFCHAPFGLQKYSKPFVAVLVNLLTGALIPIVEVKRRSMIWAEGGESGNFTYNSVFSVQVKLFSSSCSIYILTYKTSYTIYTPYTAPSEYKTVKIKKHYFRVHPISSMVKSEVIKTLS